jgi:hypothetical protein
MPKTNKPIERTIDVDTLTSLLKDPQTGAPTSRDSSLLYDLARLIDEAKLGPEVTRLTQKDVVRAEKALLRVAQAKASLELAYHAARKLLKNE